MNFNIWLSDAKNIATGAPKFNSSVTTVSNKIDPELFGYPFIVTTNYTISVQAALKDDGFVYGSVAKVTNFTTEYTYLQNKRPSS